MAALVDLTTEVLGTMAPGRFFRDTTAPINSLDFHRSAELLVCAGASRRAGGTGGRAAAWQQGTRWLRR